MTTHVFIVDSKTFKVHLEYLFAGTGAGNKYIDFNNSKNTEQHHSSENVLIEMIADANRIRSGDKIIFYLQQNKGEAIYEGKFFGVFKAKNNWSFLDNNDDDQYLKNKLEKSLTFRTLIEPYEVYSKGVTEWEALDEIKNIQSPNQMLWSLIYRKLKGNRGNTMITIYESERLCQLIRNKNLRKQIDPENKKLSFNKKEQEIVLTEELENKYEGRTEELNLLPRLIAKYENNRAFEGHLQAYIVKNIGQSINDSLDKSVLGTGFKLEWLGNEVSCGVGMQRIDVVASIIRKEQRILLPIELKATEADLTNTQQIQRYIDWIEQYYIPNKQSDIQPVLISKKINDKDSENYKKLISNFNIFNDHNDEKCKKLKYIEYCLKGGRLIFKEINY